MRVKKAKLLSVFFLAGIMSFQMNSIVSAAPENVQIGSEVWETPQLPRAAKEVSGINQTEISLNETTGDGTWQFLFDVPDYKTSGIPMPDAEEQDFDFKEWNDQNWQNIKVPGETLMQGFDVLTNNEYYYQRNVTIPKDYAGHNILLRFDGVYSNTRVWLDGKFVRLHEGGFTSWDCDLTEFVTPGETVTLTVGVTSLYGSTEGIWNPDPETNSGLDDPSHAVPYARHNLHGILRDVSLIALAPDYIARTYVKTEFDENFKNADLEVTAQLGMVSEEAQLLVELLDGDTMITSGVIDYSEKSDDLGELPELMNEAETLLEKNKENLYTSCKDAEEGEYSEKAYQTLEEKYDQAERFRTGQYRLSQAKKLVLPVENPKQWNAEHPNLYTLRTTLKVDGKEIQVNEEKVGFREITYGGSDGSQANKVYVNGSEVKLRGTNRHDMSYEMGRSITKEQAWNEIKAYKEANINFIRTSHYPPSEDILEACDELGIYVLEEAPVCFQGSWGVTVYGKYETYMNQFTEMIERDRNHPSIIIWSLGNESTYANIVDHLGKDPLGDEKTYVKDVDPTRPIILSFPKSGDPAFTDLNSRHYSNVTGNLGSKTQPQLHDEFAHVACYNFDELTRDTNVRNFWGESLKKGWENIFNSEGALGCAIWGGVDEVFHIPEGTSGGYGNGSSGPTTGTGEWGCILDVYGREKPEAYLVKKAFSPIRVDEEKCIMYAGGSVTIPVSNWYDHTNFNELKLIWSADGGEAHEVFGFLDLAPHQNGTITLTGVPEETEILNLKFYENNGHLADEYNVNLVEQGYGFIPACENAPVINETEDTITISGNEFSVSFGKDTGLIKEGKYDDTVMLTGGPYLHVAEVDLGAWIPEKDDGITAELKDNWVVVTLKGSYADGQGVEFIVKISGNGIIDTQYTLTTELSDTLSTKLSKDGGLKEVGVRYDIPLGMENVSWLRDGLYSSYPEDHLGRNEGTAYLSRDGYGSYTAEERYGVIPDWPWNLDTKNYFIYDENDANNGLVTNDFKAMREHIWNYNVNYGNDMHISVESSDADVAARVAVEAPVTYIDDRDSNIKYEGSWSKTTPGGAYDSTEMETSQNGAASELSFTGTGIRCIGSIPTAAKCKVYIDGELRDVIELISNVDTKQQPLYAVSDLSNEQHTIKLEAVLETGEKLVLDAFEVLNTSENTKRLTSSLIVNNQWYYRGLSSSWGNYLGNPGTLQKNSSGNVTVRLTNEDTLIWQILPSVSQVMIGRVEGQEDLLQVSYTISNETEDTTLTYQWYRIPAGGTDDQAQLLEGENQDTLNTANLLPGKIYCVVTPSLPGYQGMEVSSNQITVGEGTYKVVDVKGSDAEAKLSVSGCWVDKDADKTEIQSAYGKSLAYLMSADNGKLTFTFTGNGISWLGVRQNNRGIAKVQIDGEEPVEIDTYSGNSAAQYAVLFEKRFDSAGEHTLTIECNGKNPLSKGGNIAVDALIVTNDAEGANDPSSENSDAEGVNDLSSEINDAEGANDILGETDNADAALEYNMVKTASHRKVSVMNTVVSNERNNLETVTKELKEAIAAFKQSKAGSEGISHQWGEWVVKKPATEIEEGEKQRTCQVCGMIQTEKMEKLPGGTTDSGTDESNGSLEKGDQSGMVPDTGDSLRDSVLIMTIISGLILVGGVILRILVKKRQR